MEPASTMTNVYIVKHLNVFHSRILQNQTTNGVHKNYDKRLHCQSSECVSQSYPAKSNNIWSTQVTMTNIYTVSHRDTQTKHYLRYNKVLVKTGIYVRPGS